MTNDRSVATPGSLSRRDAVEAALAASLGIGAAAAAQAEAARPASGHPDIHLGLDGWLFLSGGSNQAIRYYTEPDFLDERRVQGWVERLRRRGQSVQALGARYVHLFSPDKISIYSEFFGEELPFFDRRPNAVMAGALREAGLGRVLLDAEGALRDHKPAGLQYPKIDTHWTAAGVHTVYAAICAHFGLAPNLRLEERSYEERLSAGDLGSKLTPPHRVPVRSYRILRDARRVYANGLVEEGERRGGGYPSGLLSGSHVAYRNDAPTAHDAKLMLFGDSYSGVFGQGLTMMLAESFRELHFFWSNSVDVRLVERHRPDLVVSELAERFARMLPNDDRDVVAAAEKRLRLYRENQGSGR